MVERKSGNDELGGFGRQDRNSSLLAVAVGATAMHTTQIWKRASRFRHATSIFCIRHGDPLHLDIIAPVTPPPWNTQRREVFGGAGATLGASGAHVGR